MVLWVRSGPGASFLALLLPWLPTVNIVSFIFVRSSHLRRLEKQSVLPGSGVFPVVSLGPTTIGVVDWRCFPGHPYLKKRLPASIMDDEKRAYES